MFRPHTQLGPLDEAVRSNGPVIGRRVADAVTPAHVTVATGARPVGASRARAQVFERTSPTPGSSAGTPPSPASPEPRPIRCGVGQPAGSPPDRRSGHQQTATRELEVFVFLAVNGDRPVANDDIRAALAGPTNDESSAATVRTWLSRIRSALGNHTLPEADNGRYRLTGIDLDITRLEHLARQAAAAADPAEAARLLQQALELVRGHPFEGLDYRWTHLLVANLETQIADTALRLAERSHHLGDPATAAWAAQRGLAATTQPDDRLLAHLLHAGAAQGQLTQAWREVTARYAAVGDAPGPHLVTLYDRLGVADHRSASAEP